MKKLFLIITLFIALGATASVVNSTIEDGKKKEKKECCSEKKESCDSKKATVKEESSCSKKSDCSKKTSCCSEKK